MDIVNEASDIDILESGDGIGSTRTSQIKRFLVTNAFLNKYQL